MMWPPGTMMLPGFVRVVTDRPLVRCPYLLQSGLRQSGPGKRAGQKKYHC